MKNETLSFSPEDVILSYIFEDDSYFEVFQKYIVFQEGISSDLQEVLKNREVFFKKQDLPSREKYKALAFQSMQKSLNFDEHSSIIQKLCEQINRASFK